MICRGCPFAIIHIFSVAWHVYGMAYTTHCCDTKKQHLQAAPLRQGASHNAPSRLPLRVALGAGSRGRRNHCATLMQIGLKTKSANEPALRAEPRTTAHPTANQSAYRRGRRNGESP